MDIPPESLAANRSHWDERAPAHAASPDYAVDRFLADPEFLSDVVRFDLPRLGDMSGLRGVHLQCHIGTDTISLVRLGAHMTGLDFSAAALDEARRLAAATGADVEFVQAEVHRALDVLPAGGFDLVYTGVADALVIGFPYFEHGAPLVFDEPGTYVATDVAFTHTESHIWNHGLGEIVTALLDHGMTLTRLAEHDSVPWNALPGQMEELDDGEWRLVDRPGRLAHSYTLQAVKQ